MTPHKTHDGRRLMASLVLVVALAVALLGVMASSSRAAAGDTTRVSVSSTGAQANGDSYWHSISADGRFVAYESVYSHDILMHDRQTGTTELVSVNSSGAPAKGDSKYPSLSADGHFVAFSSDAKNLVANDTNGKTDVFVHEF